MNTKRNESKPDAPATSKAKIDRQYLCPGKASICFYIPIRGEDGKAVPEKDVQGNQRFNGVIPLFKTQLCKFDQLTGIAQLTGTNITMCGYLLRADDAQYDDKFEVLEKMRLDPSNMVMDKGMYEKWRNPEAADAILENRAMKAAIAEKDDTLALMQAEIDELNEKLRDAAGKKE